MHLFFIIWIDTESRRTFTCVENSQPPAGSRPDVEESSSLSQGGNYQLNSLFNGRNYLSDGFCYCCILIVHDQQQICRFHYIEGEGFGLQGLCHQPAELIGQLAKMLDSAVVNAEVLKTNLQLDGATPEQVMEGVSQQIAPSEAEKVGARLAPSDLKRLNEWEADLIKQNGRTVVITV